MPRTKLHKGDNDSSKNTQINGDDVMADFQMPDELRKQLEYVPQQKKRQLQVDHAEKKLTERLETINVRLKEDKTKVSVQRVGDSLYLQATLPLKPGETSKDGNPNKQTKIPVRAAFNAEGLKTAEEEARDLGKLKARGTFQWNEKYLGTKATAPEAVPTIGELLEQFEDRYFLTRKRNRQSESSFCEYKYKLSLYLPLKEYLEENTILKTLQKTTAGSGARRGLVTSLSVFCNTFSFKFDFKGYKNGYEPQKRILPTDDEIESYFSHFKVIPTLPNYQWKSWQWVYGMLATYGLRPHEIFAIDVKAFTDPANIMHELKLDESLTDGVKTGERIIFPLHPRWVELFDLKSAKMPITGGTFANNSNRICRNFKSAKISFQPYHLRHAYAVRGHKLGIPLKEMADNMGHSVEMHTRTYQKYMTNDTRRIVYQNAIIKSNNAEVELTEIEQLRSENTALKAENEQLKALVIEHQLHGLLKP